MTAKPSQASASRSSGRSIALAATVIMAGNLLSRLVALVREKVIASQFGATSEVALFSILSAIPTQLYDMLVGGLLSAALIPIFSEYVEQDRQEFWRIAATVISLVLLVMSALAGIIALFPRFFIELLASEVVVQEPQLYQPAVTTLRLMLISVVLLAVKGLFEALLQAQQRFLLPALATSLFNLGMIIAALLFAQLGMAALALGMSLGALAQVLVQLPGVELRQLRPRLELRHPAVRRIGRLYMPVALGTLFALIGTTVDRRLAGIIGGNTAAIMRFATTLIQFVLGLIVAAIGLAILPSISRRTQDDQGFQRIFGMGFKIVLLLIIPATVMLGVLATPVTRLLFEGGKFTPADTTITALALLAYLPSLLAIAVDQLLLYAFYARKSTLLPNLVQGAAIACYLLVATLSYRAWGIYGLILANVAQHLAHMTLMLWLGQRRYNLLSGQRVGATLWRVALASTLMGGLVVLVARLAGGLLQSPRLSALLQVALGGALGLVVYLLLLSALKVEALGALRELLGRRLGRSKPEVLAK